MVTAAAAAWWLTNYALVVLAILLSSDERISAKAALGHPADKLLLAADRALPHAKKTGRNRVVPALSFELATADRSTTDPITTPAA